MSADAGCAGLCVAAVLLQGCSTLGAKTPGAKLDPWENWNRKVFTFNEKLDEKVLKPVATTYSNLVPRPVRSGVDNFFGPPVHCGTVTTVDTVAVDLGAVAGQGLHFDLSGGDFRNAPLESGDGANRAHLIPECRRDSAPPQGCGSSQIPPPVICSPFPSPSPAPYGQMP